MMAAGEIFQLPSSDSSTNQGHTSSPVFFPFAQVLCSKKFELRVAQHASQVTTTV